MKQVCERFWTTAISVYVYYGATLSFCNYMYICVSVCTYWSLAESVHVLCFVFF